MKKSIRFISLLLAAVLAASLSSCGFVNISINNPFATPFTRGYISGNVYKSSFLGLTFEKPADWTFLSDEESAGTYDISLDLMKSSEAFANAAEGKIVDFGAKSANEGDTVGLVCAKGGAYSTLQSGIDATINAQRSELQSHGTICMASKPADAKLGKIDVKSVMLTFVVQALNGGFPVYMYYYFMMVDNYFAYILCTTATETADLAFEAMFS